MRLGFPIDRIDAAGSRPRVSSRGEQVAVDRLILCAGLDTRRARGA